MQFDFREESVDPIFGNVMEQLSDIASSIPDTQKRMMEITGVAWSEDRMVKVVVGPRGQLVDLDIDARVFRNPDATRLRSMILSTTQQAVREVTEQVREIMDGQMPPEIAEIQQKYAPDWDDSTQDLLRSDAEIYAERKESR
jgi:DNA-binding protein YbaB